MPDPTPTAAPADLAEAEQLLRSPQDFESADAPYRPDLLTFAAAARVVLAEYDRRAQALAEAEEGRVAAVELWQRTVRDLAPAADERDRLRSELERLRQSSARLTVAAQNHLDDAVELRAQRAAVLALCDPSAAVVAGGIRFVEAAAVRRTLGETP